MDQFDQGEPAHLIICFFAVINLPCDQINSSLCFFNKINNAVAIIAVHGKPDPTPNGKMDNRNIMAPTDPILYSHPFSSIEIAIKPWQVAMSPTASCI